MITFNYTDGNAEVTVTTRHEHLEGLMEDFKKFLLFVGFRQENVENISYDEPRRSQGLQQAYDEYAKQIPGQLDLFTPVDGLR